jgi:hypothetical protein
MSGEFKPEFLSSGVIFGDEERSENFFVIHYKHIATVREDEGTNDFDIWCVNDDHEDGRSYTIKCNHAQERIDMMRELRKRKAEWLETDAIQRKEKREFRAALLALLGRVTERLDFDPDVGEEAIEAVDRCKKRARGEGEEN